MRMANFCGRIQEAGLLLAVAVSVLYFNLLSSRVFDPDKIALARAIGLIMLAAFATAWIEARINQKSSPMAPGKAPPPLLTILLVAFFTWSGLTCLWSLVPVQSILGSTARLQGFDTLLLYALAFLVCQTLFIERTRIDRLLTVFSVLPIPVCLYGIAQHHRLDPVNTSAFWDSADRPLSSMGNPIATAAIVSLLSPLTIHLLLTKSKEVFQGSLRFKKLFSRGLLLANLIILIWAWHYQYWAGCIASVITIVAWAAASKLTTTSINSAVACAALLASLAMQILCIAYTQSRGGALALIAGVFLYFLIKASAHRQRAVLWMMCALVIGIAVGVLVLNFQGPANPLHQKLPTFGRLTNLFDASGNYRLDTWAAVQSAIVSSGPRLWIGHGIECFAEPANAFLPGHLTRGALLVDRSHCDFLDQTLMTGVIGLVLFFAWVTAMACWVLLWLGIARTKAQILLFLACWVGGGIVAAFAMYSVKPAVVFVMFIIGPLAGLTLFILIQSFLRQSASNDSHLNDEGKSLLAALLAGFLSHLVEVAFCFPVGATRLVFFIYAALAIVVGQRRIAEYCSAVQTDTNSPLPDQRKQKPANASLSAPVSGGLVPIAGICLALFVSSFVGPHNYYTDEFAVRLLVLCIATFLLSGIIVGFMDHENSSLMPSLKRMFKFLIFTTGASFILSLIRSKASPDPFFADAIIAGSFLFVIAATLLLALYLNRTSAERWRPGGTWIGYLALFAASGAAGWALNGRTVLADIYNERSARLFGTESGSDRTIALARAGRDLDPNAPHYHCHLAACLVSRVYEMPPGPERDKFTDEADQAMLTAYELNPMSVKTNNRLVHYYRVRYQMKNDMKVRAGLILESLKWAEMGLKLLPNDVLPRRLFSEILPLAADIHYELNDMDRAEPLYLRMLENGINPARAHLALGTVYINKKMFDKAEGHLDQAYQQAPADWRVSYNLASFHLTKENFEQALRYARVSLAIAPEKQRVALQSVIDSISLKNVTLIKPRQ